MAVMSIVRMTLKSVGICVAFAHDNSEISQKRSSAAFSQTAAELTRESSTSG